MMLPTAKRAPQIPPPRVAGMREKANPAVRAVSNAALKLAVGLQHRVQRSLILPDKRSGAIVLMPIRAKVEKLLDGDGKKARLSAILSIVVDTPSSYLFNAKASRGRARFFCARRARTWRDRPHNRSAAYCFPSPFCLPSRCKPVTPQIPTALLGKKEGIFFLPSSG